MTTKLADPRNTCWESMKQLCMRRPGTVGTIITPDGTFRLTFTPRDTTFDSPEGARFEEAHLGGVRE